MNIAQKVAFNTTAQIAGQLAGVLVSLVTLRLTTGYLGIDDFGELAIILAVGGLVVTISELGVATTLARELAKTPRRTDSLAGSLLRYRAAASLAFVLATLAIVPALPYSSQTKVGLIVYLVGVLAQSLATFPRAFFQTELKLHFQAIVEFATKVLSLAAVTVVVFFDLGFYALVGALSVVGVAALGLTFWFLLRLWKLSLRWERTLGTRLIRDSLGVGAVSLIGLLHFRGDVILLSFLAPASDVGIYAVAYRFVDQAFVLPGFFVAAVFPILTRLVHEGPGRVDATLNRVFQVLALSSVAVALAVFTLARPVVLLIAGDDFEEAVGPTRTLAFSLPFIFCAPVFFNLVFAVNRQRLLVVVGLASLGLNVALNLVLIPRYTYNGAAIATVVSEATAFAGSVWVAARTVDFGFDWVFLVRAAAATAAAAVVAAIAFRVSDLLAFVLAEVTLLTIAYFVGAVRTADLRAVLGRGQPTGTA